MGDTVIKWNGLFPGHLAPQKSNGLLLHFTNRFTVLVVFLGVHGEAAHAAELHARFQLGEPCISNELRLLRPVELWSWSTGDQKERPCRLPPVVEILKVFCRSGLSSRGAHM